jgi:signal peptidase II
MLWVYIVALIAVALDQLSKRLVELLLRPVGDVPLIYNVLHLTYMENTGASFGMLSGMRWVFVGISFAAVVAIAIYINRRKLPFHRVELLSQGMIMGGAVGNLLDRLILGRVTDFIYVRAINFAVFNIADSFVSVGAVLLCVYILFFHEKYAKTLAPEPRSAPDDADQAHS